MFFLTRFDDVPNPQGNDVCLTSYIPYHSMCNYYIHSIGEPVPGRAQEKLNRRGGGEHAVGSAQPTAKEKERIYKGTMYVLQRSWGKTLLMGLARCFRGRPLN